MKSTADRPLGDAACAARSLRELHLISQLALTASPPEEAFGRGREMVSLPALFGSPGDDGVSGGTG